MFTNLTAILKKREERTNVKTTTDNVFSPFDGVPLINKIKTMASDIRFIISALGGVCFYKDLAPLNLTNDTIDFQSLQNSMSDKSILLYRKVSGSGTDNTFWPEQSGSLIAFNVGWNGGTSFLFFLSARRICMAKYNLFNGISELIGWFDIMPHPIEQLGTLDLPTGVTNEGFTLQLSNGIVTASGVLNAGSVTTSTTGGTFVGLVQHMPAKFKPKVTTRVQVRCMHDSGYVYAQLSFFNASDPYIALNIPAETTARTLTNLRVQMAYSYAVQAYE